MAGSGLASSLVWVSVQHADVRRRFWALGHQLPSSLPGAQNLREKTTTVPSKCSVAFSFARHRPRSALELSFAASWLAGQPARARLASAAPLARAGGRRPSGGGPWLVVWGSLAPAPAWGSAAPPAACLAVLGSLLPGAGTSSVAAQRRRGLARAPGGGRGRSRSGAAQRSRRSAAERVHDLVPGLRPEGLVKSPAPRVLRASNWGLIVVSMFAQWVAASYLLSVFFDPKLVASDQEG